MPCFYGLKLLQARLKIPNLINHIWKLACSLEMREVATEIRSYPDFLERSFLQCSTNPTSHDFIEHLKEEHEVHCFMSSEYDRYTFILALDDDHFIIAEDHYEDGSHWYESSTLIECFATRDGGEVKFKFGRYYYQYRSSYEEDDATYYSIESHIHAEYRDRGGGDRYTAAMKCVDLHALQRVAEFMGGGAMIVVTTFASGKEWLYPDVVREGLCPNRHPPEDTLYKPMFGPSIIDDREFDLGEGHPDRPGGHGDFIFVNN